MSTFVLDQGGVIHRLTVIGIPHDVIKPYSDLIAKWVRCSGVEWTVKRLKSLKVDFIRIRAGLDPTSRIRKNSLGEIYGPIGRLFRWGLKNRKQFYRTVQALMSYSNFVSNSLTKSQREKFESAVNCSTPLTLGPTFYTTLVKVVQKFVGQREVRFREDLNSRLITFRGSPNKKAPVVKGRSVIQNQHLDAEAEYLLSDSGTRLYMYFKDLYGPCLDGLAGLTKALDRRLFDVRGDVLHPENHLIGSVHFLQEPGLKLRSIASPFRINQIVMNPLGKSCYSIVRSLPWDCTFDQSRAVPHIQAALADGKTVHSVDLSSATDYFPLELQSFVLRSIFGSSSRDVKLFEFLSRGYWNSSIGPVSWKRGQPLGLYPSFAVFTLTHGLLLALLSNNQHDDQFFVVGDDVVILNDDLYHRYIALLKLLGCPWSSDKSLSSNRLSEFAGKIITDTDVIDQYKWRKMSDDNFLDLCRNLGPRSRSLLTRNQKMVFDVVKHLLPPIGLNFSKDGSDYHSMMVETESVLSVRQEVVLGSLVGLTPLIYSNLATDGVVNDLSKYTMDAYRQPYGISSIISTFDEKVRAAFHGLPFEKMVEENTAFAVLVNDLPGANRDDPRLPLEFVEPSRLTTLQKIQRLLGI